MNGLLYLGPSQDEKHNADNITQSNDGISIESPTEDNSDVAGLRKRRITGLNKIDSPGTIFWFASDYKLLFHV